VPDLAKHFNSRKRRESGSALLVVLILISVMTVYLVANVISLNVLKTEIQLIEKQQLKRQNQSNSLGKQPTGTNSVERPGPIANQLDTPQSK